MGLIPGLGIQGIQGCPLEEGIVTPFSILAWRIPLTEEPGGLQSMGSQRDTTKQLSIAQHKTKGFADMNICQNLLLKPGLQLK